jgi:hypothetical protein
MGPTYTYKDWLKATVVLKYDLFIPRGETPVFVGWEDFSEIDQSLIREKQEAIFDEEVNTLFEKYKALFIKKYEKIPHVLDGFNKEECLKNEILQCEQVFYSKVSPGGYLSTNIWHAAFDYDNVTEIQRFYNRVIIGGFDFDYNFIHPVGSKYIDKSKIPIPIYVSALWKFYCWLKEGELSPSVVKGKFEALVEKLESFGFFNLPKIKLIGSEKAIIIIKKCLENGIPYTVAMFSYLEYFEYLKSNHFKTDVGVDKEVASWLEIGGRTIKGNRLTMSERSNEDRVRYTAHIYKEKVEKDYKS